MFDFDVRSGNEQSASQTVCDQAAAPAGDDWSAAITAIPRRPALVVTPTCRLRQASRLMEERQMSAAVVASHGVLLGLLTERDVVRRLMNDSEAAGDLPVWRVMAAQPETLLESDTVAYTARKLWLLGGRAMPILSPSGELLGLLEAQDLLAWMCGRVGAPPQKKSPRILG